MSIHTEYVAPSRDDTGRHRYGIIPIYGTPFDQHWGIRPPRPAAGQLAPTACPHVHWNTEPIRHGNPLIMGYGKAGADPACGQASWLIASDRVEIVTCPKCIRSLGC
jgi:hypothetical protein